MWLCANTHSLWCFVNTSIRPDSHRWGQSSISPWGCAAQKLHSGKWAPPCPPLCWTWVGSSSECHPYLPSPKIHTDKTSCQMSPMYTDNSNAMHVPATSSYKTNVWTIQDQEKWCFPTFLPESVSSTTHSSPCSSLRDPASKPSFSEGTHTSFLVAQSAWAKGLLMPLRSPYRNLSASVMVALRQSKGML